MLSLRKKVFFITLLLFSSFVFMFAEEDNQDFYKKAVELEDAGDFGKAVYYYKKHSSDLKDNIIKERLDLKIARLTPVYHDAVKEYKSFLSRYPDSSFRFIALYELALLHRINGYNKAAQKEFEGLAKISGKTEYWKIAKENIALLEYELGNYNAAIKNINEILKTSDKTEDFGFVYYLRGKVFVERNDLTNAEKDFSFCMEQYPASDKAPSALFEIISLYIKDKKFLRAKKMYALMNELYPDSPENYEANLLIKQFNDKTNADLLDIEEISVDNSGSDINDNETIFLMADMKNSLRNNNKINNKMAVDFNMAKEAKEPAYYVQLGYFAALDSAKYTVEKYKKLGVTNVYYGKTRSSKDANVFYRVLLGPFTNKEESNQKLIELKEKNIESIILELVKE